MVFNEGDAGERLHLIESGLAGVSRVTGSGKRRLLNVLAEGQTFGEIALSRDGVRSATIYAITGLRTTSLGRSDLDRIRHLDTSFDRVLMAALAAHVERLSDVVLESRNLEADQRCIKRLAQLCPPGATQSYDVPLNQEELGAFVGVSRQTVNQALQQLETDGLAIPRRGRVSVVDLPRLRKLASDIVL